MNYEKMVVDHSKIDKYTIHINDAFNKVLKPLFSEKIKEIDLDTVGETYRVFIEIGLFKYSFSEYYNKLKKQGYRII